MQKKSKNPVPAKKTVVTTVTKQAPQEKKKNKPKNTGAKKATGQGSSGHRYLALIKNPFDGTGTRIPDFDTTPSGLASSEFTATYSSTAITGTSTTHSIGWWFPPFPDTLRVLQETSAGNLTLSEFSNATGTTFNTVVSGANSVPNWGGLHGGNSAKVRLVAMGVEVSYLGTELNRSGRISAGLMPIVQPGGVVSSTGTQYSSVATCTGSVTNTTVNLINKMQRRVEGRIGGSLRFIWLPNEVPVYQTINATGANSLPSAGTAGAAVANPNYLYAPTSSGGVQANLCALCIVVEGDTSSSAAVGGNSYAVRYKAHWEIVPADEESITYELSKSASDVMALQAAFNQMPELSVQQKMGF